MRPAVIGLILTCLATPCLASPMVVSWATWLRAGPGVGARVLNELPAGFVVELQGCANGWCRVVSDHAEGWVDQAMLAPSRGAPVVKAAGDCFPATHFTPERAIPLEICPAVGK